MDIRLPFPPSVNGYWRAFKRGNICTQIISKKGREYRAAVEDKMFDYDYKTYYCKLKVEITLYPPDKRKRDLDNYTKATLDALTHAGVWDDDSQIDHLTIKRGIIVKPGFVDIKIKQL